MYEYKSNPSIFKQIVDFKYLNSIIVGVWAGFLLLVTLFDVYRAHMKSSSFRNEIREMFGPGRSDSINEAEIERLIENNLVPSKT